LFGIPDFRYYDVADGLKVLMDGFRRPFLEKNIPELKHPQPVLTLKKCGNSTYL
jgi:hypothetical protein